MFGAVLQRFLVPKPGQGSNLKSLQKCSFDVRLTASEVVSLAVLPALLADLARRHPQPVRHRQCAESV